MGVSQQIAQQISTADSQMMTPSLSTDQPSQTLEKWEDKHVCLLIECYLKYKDRLGKPQQTNKKVFEKIAEEFNHTSDVVVSGENGKNWNRSKRKLRIMTKF